MLVSPCSMSTAGFDHLKDSVGAQCAVRKPREGVLPHFTRSHRRSVFGRGVECAGTEMVAVSGGPLGFSVLQLNPVLRDRTDSLVGTRKLDLVEIVHCVDIVAPLLCQ